MVEYQEKNTCISGLGQSDVFRKPQTYPFELAVQACYAAIEDAGLKASDIDGVCGWPDTPIGVGDGFGAASVSDIVASLGLNIKWHSSANMAAQLSPILTAVAVIAAGYCNHVLCWRSVGERTGGLRGQSFGSESRTMQPVGGLEYISPYHAPSAAIWCAIHASTHMHKYGITKEQMGAVPIVQRANAALNEKAIYRNPMDMDEYLNGRIVCTPFSIYDCDVPCDGSTAIVVSRLDTAPDLRHKPIILEAVGAGTGDRIDTWLGRSDYPRMAMHDAAANMWARTDLKPKDVDTAHLYDGFSHLTLLWLEAMGFCGEGESGAFIEGGERISRTGELPLNTNGGQLSEGRLHGIGHLHEACLQLRGAAGARQVPNVNLCAVGNGGGSVGGAVLVRNQ